MKGFKYIQNGREHDLPPCFFCKNREKTTNCAPCYNCMSLMDLALHKPNSKTEFVDFEPISEEYLTVLRKEQKNEI